MTPTFDSGTFGYTAGLGGGVTRITVAATASDSKDTVSIFPADADDQTAGHQIDVSTGANNIRVTVEDDVLEVSVNYSLVMTRAKSNDATLKALTVREGGEDGALVTLSPRFAPGRTANSATVHYDVTQVTVAATKNESNATVTMPTDDDTTEDGTQVNLSLGSNTVTVTVTAEDGTKRNYTITITRNADSALKSLTAIHGSKDSISYTPTLAARTYSYTTVKLAHYVQQATVSAAARHSGATLSTTPADADGNKSGHQVDLGLGQTHVRVTVTASDGTKSTYTLSIVRGADATLSGLRVTDGGGNAVTISPPFAAGVTSYTASVAKGATAATLVASANNKYATVAITPADTDGNTSGHQATLVPGDNSFTITVTGQDNSTTKTYNLTISRAYDADLKSLDISHGSDKTAVTLSPAFSSGTTTYAATVANAVGSVIVEPRTSHTGAGAVITPGANDSGNHLVNLGVGSNTVTVTVTAGDGTTTKTYTVTVTRAAA